MSNFFLPSNDNEKSIGASNQHHLVSLPWIDRAKVEKELAFIKAAAETGKEGDKTLQVLLQKILDGPIQKRFVLAPYLKAVQALAEKFPNFSHVIEFFLGELALQLSASAKPYRITPILLLGDPGIGKTMLAKSLASVFGVTMDLISLSTATSGFALSGMDRGWGSAHQGKIFNTFLKQDAINPIIVLDEADKSSTDSKSDPLGPLYQLLEEETAKEFVDEFVGVPINASFITWIITANSEDHIPSPLLSRMRVFHIKPPNAQQMVAIVKNQYCKLRERFPSLVENLPIDVLATLSHMSPRQSALQLLEATGKAALRSRLSRSGLAKVQIEDVGECHPVKRSIGFT